MPETSRVTVTGHALASAPLLRRAIDTMAQLPRGTASAAALVGFVACLAGLINWGLGLIIGAIQQAWVPYKFQIHAQDEDPAGFFRTSFTFYTAGVSFRASSGPESVFDLGSESYLILCRSSI